MGVIRRSTYVIDAVEIRDKKNLHLSNLSAMIYIYTPSPRDNNSSMHIGTTFTTRHSHSHTSLSIYPSPTIH